MEYPSIEHQEGALDTLLQLCRIPSFLTDLYLNYDCDLYCTDLFQCVVSFLSQNAFPEDQVLTTHLNALDSLLTLVNEVAGRGPAAATADVRGVPSLPSVDALNDQKRKKTLLKEAAEKFNGSAKKGMAFLKEHQLIAEPPTPEQVCSLPAV